jgi:hypothetical protein
VLLPCYLAVIGVRQSEAGHCSRVARAPLKGVLLMKPRAPRGKTMRVATALTGMTACATGFLPAAAAHAATSAGRAGNPAKARTGEGKLVRLKVVPGGITPGGRTIRPDITAAPDEPYWLSIHFKTSVSLTQVCGWHPNNRYACTPWTETYYSPDGLTKSLQNVGGNQHSWDLGEIKVYWNGGGLGRWDECNTNGTWEGYWSYAFSGYRIAVMNSKSGGGIGNGVPEC